MDCCIEIIRKWFDFKSYSRNLYDSLKPKQYFLSVAKKSIHYYELVFSILTCFSSIGSILFHRNRNNQSNVMHLWTPRSILSQSASNVSWTLIENCVITYSNLIYHICKEKKVNLSYSACHEKRQLPILVWKFWIDYHLNLSPMTEIGFPSFLTFIKTTVKIDINSSVLFKVSNWDLKSKLFYERCFLNDPYHPTWSIVYC